MILSEDKLMRILDNAKISYDKKDIYANCPKCGHNEFGISLVRENNPFNCFRKKKCGWEGNGYDLLKFLGIDMPTAPVNLAEMSSIKEKEVDVLEIWLPEIQYPIGWNRVYDHSYLNERGFTPEDYERYEVGVIRLKNNYVYFAVKMNKKLVGYVGRRLYDWVNPKYNNSITDFSKAIYGYDDVKQGSVVIAGEGALDKKAIDKKLRLPNHVGIATFGGKFTDEQIELLKIKDVKILYLMHESDILNKVKKTAVKLAKHFDTKICYTPKDKDPDTMTVQEMESAYQNATSSIGFNLGYMKNGLQK
jgi:hypothetical protein